MNTPLEILMPVCNEEEGIYSVAKEWAETVNVPFRFIFVEDGSSDNTLLELARIAQKWDSTIISSRKRLGYSKAVVAGIRQSSADWLLAVDSDGQCDPADFPSFWKKRKDSLFVSGVRDPRQDNFTRRAASFLFSLYYRLLGGAKMRDTSCPYILGSSEDWKLLAEEDPYLEYGYWWEFHMRRKSQNIPAIEIHTNHRKRSAGETKIYLPTKMLSIGAEEARRLRALRNNIQKQNSHSEIVSNLG